MSNTTHAFDFLSSACPARPLFAVFGDEPFLKGLVIRRVRETLLGDDSDAPFATFDGQHIAWKDVADELSTIALFGGGSRFVVVENADPFVTRYRDRLETYCEKPKATGVLVLAVGTWAKNTRLYKLIDRIGCQVECKVPVKATGKRSVPDEGRVRKWIIDWGQDRHAVKVEKNAAATLLELVGPEFGLLDQDLAKLALFADDGPITDQMVRDIVGGWRATTIWELVDAATEGNAADALVQLDHLLQSGEHPVALFGQLAWSLRRLAAATRIYEAAERRGQRTRLSDALISAGFQHWNQAALAKAEKQLVQLGRDRTGQFYRWLLEIDLALKGSHSAPHRARFVLERLILRMASRPKRQNRPGR